VPAIHGSTRRFSVLRALRERYAGRYGPTFSAKLSG